MKLKVYRTKPDTYLGRLRKAGKLPRRLHKSREFKSIILTIVLFVIILALFFFFTRPPNPCRGLSEAECFAQLSDCIEADSPEEFIYSRDAEEIKQISVEWERGREPVPMNFPNAKIFLGISDKGTLPFIGLDTRYCSLGVRHENLRTVFGYIRNKKHALNYFVFVDKTLRGGSNAIYIFDEEDYASLDTNCYIETIKNRVTEIEKEEDGYLITFVGFTSAIRDSFFESVIKIKFDGTIVDVSGNTILDC